MSQALVFFWGEVTEHRDVNKMGPDNIAIVVGTGDGGERDVQFSCLSLLRMYCAK